MRIQLELPDTIANRVRSLMKEADIKTYSEYFGYALTGLDWMAKERRQGRMIVSTDRDFTKVLELSMPILDAISLKAEEQARQTEEKERVKQQPVPVGSQTS